MNTPLVDLSRGFVQKVLDRVALSLSKQTTEGLTADLEQEVTLLFEQVNKIGGSPIEAPLFKASDDEKRLVWGWASVVTEKGVPVIDSQGDIIEIDELRKAVHEFMNSRRGDAMHMVKGVGRIVESMVLHKELQAVLGIDLQREGWLVCMKVENDEAWAKVKSGEWGAFSFGGSALREPVY